MEKLLNRDFNTSDAAYSVTVGIEDTLDSVIVGVWNIEILFLFTKLRVTIFVCEHGSINKRARTERPWTITSTTALGSKMTLFDSIDMALTALGWSGDCATSFEL